MGKLNEHEENLINLMRFLANEMMCGYSYRPNWDGSLDNDGESYRDKNLRNSMNRKDFIKIFDNIDLTECSYEILSLCGFMRMDAETSNKGLLAIPLWYYEALHRGKTKEKGLDTDIRLGCVYDFVQVTKDGSPVNGELLSDDE